MATPITKQYNGFTLYQISNQPSIPEMERWVSWSGLDIESDPEYGYWIKMKYRLWAFINDVEIPIAPGAMYVNLLADNSTCVDATGMIVPCGSPEAVSGEYDFYMQMMYVPVVIQDWVVAKLQWADSEGRFNTF
jgi:hypothetical protein